MELSGIGFDKMEFTPCLHWFAEVDQKPVAWLRYL